MCTYSDTCNVGKSWVQLVVGCNTKSDGCNTKSDRLQHEIRQQADKILPVLVFCFLLSRVRHCAGVDFDLMLARMIANAEAFESRKFGQESHLSPTRPSSPPTKRSRKAVDRLHAHGVHTHVHDVPTGAERRAREPTCPYYRYKQGLG